MGCNRRDFLLSAGQASIGVATLGPQTSSAQALQAQADAQLYLAKTLGRNQVAYEQ